MSTLPLVLTLALAGALPEGGVKSGTPLPAPGRLFARETPIDIVGNVVLPDDVYLTVLAVARGVGTGKPLTCPPPTLVRERVVTSCTSSVATSSITVERGAAPPEPDARPSAAARARMGRVLDTELADEAHVIEGVISDFLHASGYELARVDAYPRNGRIIVELDEGRLDKTVFIGQNVFRTLELQVSFDLPGGVFNRPLVEQHLADVKRLFGLEGARFEVVTLEGEAADRIDIDKANFFRRLEVLRPGHPHELHVYLVYPERRPGLAVDVLVNSVNGLMLEGTYLFRGLFMDHDRLEISAGVGARIVDPFSSEADRVTLARVKFGTQWSTPPLGVPWLRSTLLFEGDLRGRRRFDLGVQRFFYFPLRGELNVGFEAQDVALLTLGAGLEQAYLFGILAREGTDLASEVGEVPGESFRGFARAFGRVVFDPEEVRTARRHLLEVEGRYYPRGDLRDNFLIADATYRGALTFGFEELRLRLQGTIVEGDVSYAEQIQLGVEHMLVAYQHTFVDRVGALGLQFRVALNGDRFKVGVFDTLSVVQGLRAEPDAPRILNEIGLGAHFLWLDSLEVDAYFGLGFSNIPTDEVSFGFLLELGQAY